MGVAAERPVTPAAEDAAIDYVLRLGRALHAYGYASPALERALVTTSTRLGLIGHFFSTPNSISVAFGKARRNDVRPASAGRDRLGKLTTRRQRPGVVDGSLSPSDQWRIGAIERQPPPFGRSRARVGVASGRVPAARRRADEVLVGTGIGIWSGCRPGAGRCDCTGLFG